MYIKIINGIPEYYTIKQLQSDNPQTSFPVAPTNDLLAEWGLFKVTKVEQPTITYKQNIVEGTPELINNEWRQVWVVTEKPQDEINLTLELLRSEAYRNESDPLFFKYQRGEVEKQVWLDKVVEIKARYA